MPLLEGVGGFRLSEEERGGLGFKDIIAFIIALLTTQLLPLILIAMIMILLILIFSIK